MLVRQRISRIYYLRKFFDYPIKLNMSTLANLGASRIARIGVSYGRAILFPRRSERSLEDFLVNRFGQELYETFFRDYTEKVWGVPCNQIKPEWGAQRIKGLSVWEAIWHALGSVLRSSSQSLEQKDVQTSLIERFLYPKYGPGQLWESVAENVVSRGGKLFQSHQVVGLDVERGKVVKVSARDEFGEIREFVSDYVFSTMPIADLIPAMGNAPPQEVLRVASGLCYRDFVTIGLLVDRLNIRNQTAIPTRNGIVPDNWIYVQEPEVKVGRLQLFQNWSPYMIANPQYVWLGLEYFCKEGDALWDMADYNTPRKLDSGIRCMIACHRMKGVQGWTGACVRATMQPSRPG
jgi:protoporphyrinogen oxidase